MDLFADIKHIKEKFTHHYDGKYEEECDNSIPKHIKILSIVFNLIISILFILFSIDYINVINPRLNIPNKSIYIVLVYMMLVVNCVMCILNIVNVVKEISRVD